MIDDYTDVLVVGNGFDLNLDLKTSYSHYLDSDHFKELLQRNSLAQYLEGCKKIKMGGYRKRTIQLFNSFIL